MTVPRLQALPALEAFLAARAVPGIEEVAGGRYRRTVGLSHGLGLIGVDGTVAVSYTHLTLPTILLV